MKAVAIQLAKSKFLRQLSRVISLLLLSEIVSELEALEVLRQASKARSMIYQYEAKEQLALSIGMWPDSFYCLPYEQWQDIYRYFKE